jgi:hypothetical protein
MSHIDVRPLGPGEYAVEVSDSAQATHHRVRVDDRVLDDLALLDPDEQTRERLVRESVEFLLEREPASAIRTDFALSDISQFFPEYLQEVATRMS